MRGVCLLVFSMLLAACGSQADIPLDVLLPEMAKAYNAKDQHAITELLPGSTARARVEGEDTLVVRVENVPTGKLSADPILLSQGIRKGFCAQEGMPELLETGVRLRVEMRSNLGVELPTTYLATCVG